MHGLRWFRSGDETSKINASEERKRESDSERAGERRSRDSARLFNDANDFCVHAAHRCACVCVSQCGKVIMYVCVCGRVYVCVCPTVALAGAGALTTTSSIFSRTSCILLPLLPPSLPAASVRCLCCPLLMMMVGEWRNSITLRALAKIDEPSRVECTR